MCWSGQAEALGAYAEAAIDPGKGALAKVDPGQGHAGIDALTDVEHGELVLQLEPSGPGVGIARETADGGWQPVTRMMTLGSMGLEGVG